MAKASLERRMAAYRARAEVRAAQYEAKGRTIRWDTLILPAGTLVHVSGFPFQLATDVAVLGREENMRIALRRSANSLDAGAG